MSQRGNHGETPSVTYRKSLRDNNLKPMSAMIPVPKVGGSNPPERTTSLSPFSAAKPDIGGCKEAVSAALAQPCSHSDSVGDGSLPASRAGNGKIMSSPLPSRWAASVAMQLLAV
jgi:hypothetical protein